MRLGMSQALGKTKQAGSRLDWAEGAGWHQDKAQDPAECWWCSVDHPQGCSCLRGYWDTALQWRGAAECQPGPTIQAVEPGMWLQAPASSQHLWVWGWAGGRIHAGGVAVPVIERPGMGMGLETWRDAEKCSIALVSPALRALLPHFYSMWHLRAWCEGVAVVHKVAPLLLTVTSACCHGHGLLLAVHLWPCYPENPMLESCSVENYSCKANLRPVCTALCVCVLGGNWYIRMYIILKKWL